MNNDKMREAFEALWNEVNGKSAPLTTTNIFKLYRAALQSQSNTDGWVMVPVEPTNAMVEAAELDACGRLLADDIADAYSAMLSAAPKAPQQVSNASTRNTDWVLAMAEALGTDSGYSVPIVPTAEAFRELFAAIRSTPPQQQEQSGEAVALPERDVSKPAKQQGVFRKFEVSRVDGSDHPGGKHHGCEYFVLDVTHDQHAKAALAAYAEACKETHHELSCDMVERYRLYSPATPAATASQESAPEAGGEARPVAYRAWLDDERGARWVFTLWPEEEHLEVILEPLFLALTPATPTATASQASREEQMVTLRADESGKPTVWCDPEIADLVDALNTNKLSTVASCSGHGHRPGRISLKDGRELLVMNSEQVDVVERLFATDINGQSTDDFANAVAQEAVAYGLPNTAITGKKQALMQVRLDIPSNDQYGGALWVPLYLAPPTSIAIQAAEAVSKILNEWHDYTPGTNYKRLQSLLSKLTPANAEAELEVLMKGWKEAAIAWEVCASIHREYAKGKDALFTTRQADYTRHANEARRVLDEAKGEVK